MNQVILLGRLTREPEMRQTAGGTTVATFSLAVDFGYGEKKTTDFIDCKFFGKTAENIGKYVTKGQQILVVGRLHTGNYKNKDGNTVYFTEVLGDNFHFTESKKHKEDAPYPGAN